MQINNFNQILSLLNFTNEDHFYFLQIIQRRRENPEMLKNSRTVKSFCISSKEQFIEKFEEIKILCKFYNARAYIDLNRKSFERTSYLMLEKITNCLINKTYKASRSIFDHACGNHDVEIDKKWMIDLDIKNESILNEVINQIKRCDSDYIYPIYDVIPTINGFHILTYKFNSKQIEPYQCIQSFAIHKNANTLLYYDSQSFIT